MIIAMINGINGLYCLFIIESEITIKFHVYIRSIEQTLEGIRTNLGRKRAMKCKVCGRPLGTTDVNFEEIYGIHAGPCEHRERMTSVEYERLVAFYKKRK
jgi:hypothetical protein